jgi:hypothetical protein
LNTVLEANLEALRRSDPASADLLAAAPAAPVEWSESLQPEAPSASLQHPGGRLTLAGRYRPLEDAQRLADTADLQKHAVVVAIGFGTGYHVRALARRAADKALLIVHEPDPSLLRAVLERLDYTELLAAKGFTLLLGDLDEAAITRRLEIQAGSITQGLQFITFSPARQLCPDVTAAFMQRMARFVAYCRTNIATTLVHAATTCRNLTSNLVHYAAGPTVTELAGAAAGYPAVLVSAGPSLAKNIDLLSQPGVRDRVVIIAVQTVLKPLLDRGIRPHYVTALDYHEISRRFYEDLPPLPDVTLVAECKAHASILESFPGPIRILQNRFLDLLLGPLARRITPMRAGSTVAHLSLYLAQHLGCDPIILIGQDLGFSDGLYYCPGTAIHDVWATELSTFNTLEMMEWRRIARHKSNLKKRTDIHGRPVFSDEQMLTYLSQFERDFAAAPQKIVDATEGGMPKQHTTAMTLAAALEEFATCPLPPLPKPAGESSNLRGRLTQVSDHLEAHSDQVRELKALSRQTLPILRAMLDDQQNETKMARHFAALEINKKRVEKLSDVFKLVSELNQVGVFRRVRADRAIRVDEHADPYVRQANQLHRDIENVQWLIEGCDETLEIFSQSVARIDSRRAVVSTPVPTAVGALA